MLQIFLACNNTVFGFILGCFLKHFGDINLSAITSEDILAFISMGTNGNSQNTKKLRFTLISVFFNFVKNSLDSKISTPCDNPALRKETEVVFLPQKVADRLRTYIREKGINPDARIFLLTYAAARLIVKKAGNLVDIHVRPHSLCRHAASYASRSGTPL